MKECDYPHLGQNIRTIREQCNISVTEMLAQLADMGLVTSRARYGYWERGENTIPHSYVVAISRILGVRIETLYFWHLKDTVLITDRSVKIADLYDALLALESEELDIFHYFFTKFEGNVKAVIHWPGMYASIYVPSKRENWAGAGLVAYRDAKMDNALDPEAPFVNTELVEQVCMRMSKRK